MNEEVWLDIATSRLRETLEDVFDNFVDETGTRSNEYKRRAIVTAVGYALDGVGLAIVHDVDNGA